MAQQSAALAALGALAPDALAQEGASVLQVVQLAYTLESLEFFFYESTLNATAFAEVRAQLNNSQRTLRTLQTIRAHEQAHRDFLAQAMAILGATPGFMKPSRTRARRAG